MLNDLDLHQIRKVGRWARKIEAALRPIINFGIPDPVPITTELPSGTVSMKYLPDKDELIVHTDDGDVVLAGPNFDLKGE